MKSQKKFLFSAFLSGFAVMAAELSGARLLAPVFGNSIFVWTNMIGLVMLALALGYYFGGRFSDTHPDPKHYFNILFVAGGWIVLIPVIANVFMPWMQSLGSLANVVLLGSFLTVFFVFVMPMFLLGMIVPYSLKLVAKRLEHVGEESGKVSLFSTAGSLLGTFAPAFLLIPILGVNWSFVFIGGLLMLWSAWQLRVRHLFVALAFVLLFSLLFFSNQTEDWIFSKESAYGHVFVEEVNGQRLLYVDNEFGVQSIYEPGVVLTNRYYEYFSILPPMRPEASRVLILGHAGGSFTRMFNHYYPELQITGVEINPVVTEAARATMNLDELDVDLYHADARSFLLNTNETWDFILVDAYKGSTIPAHLATTEFFELAGSRLVEGGILGINVASKKSEFSDLLSNSFVHNFTHALALPIPQSYNTLLMGSNSAMNVQALDPALSEVEAWVTQNAESVVYSSSKDYFTDSKISLVELKNAQMLMQMYSDH